MIKSLGDRTHDKLGAIHAGRDGDKRNASGFLRLPTSLFHSPKSTMVEAPQVLLEIGYLTAIRAVAVHKEFIQNSRSWMQPSS